MRIWVQTPEAVKQFEVEDLAEAQAKVQSFPDFVDWDIFTFRQPPEEPEPLKPFQYVQF